MEYKGKKHREREKRAFKQKDNKEDEQNVTLVPQALEYCKVKINLKKNAITCPNHLCGGVGIKKFLEI